MCNSSYPKQLPFLHAMFPSSCCHIFPAPAPPFSKTPSKRCLLSLYLSPLSLGLTPFGLISFPLHEMSLVNVSPETCMLQTSFLIFLNLLVAFEQVTTPPAVKRIPHFFQDTILLFSTGCISVSSALCCSFPQPPNFGVL